MVSFSNVICASLCLLSLILITASTPLDSSPEQSLEDNLQNVNSKPNPEVKIVKPDPRTEYDVAAGVLRRPTPQVCAGKHSVCRLHGPRPRKCCGEGKALFCKIGYGEYYCFEKWESTAE